MTPVLIARTFGPGQRDEWRQMAAALASSAQRHCPGWRVDIRDERPGRELSSPLGSQNTVWNTHKLDAWCRAVDGLAEGTPVLLIDADTLIVRPLDSVWERPFDVAYTVKPKGSRFPFNAGVVFLRVSEPIRRFLRAWQAVNDRMLEDAAYYQPWRAKFGGVNQSALAQLLKAGEHGLSLERLPCAEWNCEESGWDVFQSDLTRIVHYKGELRDALFPRYRNSHIVGRLRPMVKIWRETAQVPV